MRREGLTRLRALLASVCFSHLPKARSSEDTVDVEHTTVQVYTAPRIDLLILGINLRLLFCFRVSVGCTATSGFPIQANQVAVFVSKPRIKASTTLGASTSAIFVYLVTVHESLHRSVIRALV